MTTPARDTLGTDIGGYVDPPWMAAVRVAADSQHLERAARETLSLGQLQLLLEPYPADLVVEFRGCGLDGKSPQDVDSWRGNYADLALSPEGRLGPRPVWWVCDLLKGAHRRQFTGYKGGDFWMDHDTPVWVDAWGECTFDRGITAVRPLIRRGEPAAVLIVVTDHSKADS